MGISFTRRVGSAVAALLLGLCNAADAGATGSATYLAQCARCHQRDGRGIEGVYPALRDASTLWIPRERPIQAILSGRSGPLEIDGQWFDNTMPTHGYLGNETIAATLSFLQDEWGPGGAPYTVADVAAERLKLLNQHPTNFTPLPDVSPLAGMDAVQYVTSSGPPISTQDFDKARRLYYGHCTGCHGVLRQGTAGNPLTPELMRERGTEYLKAVMHYGSSSGMPNWGTSNTLSGADIQLLALFLQHPIPQPPDMDEADLRASWKLLTPAASRPTQPEHDYDLDQLFVVTLHDVGQVAIIDGNSKQIITTIATGASPNRVRASASGRYLYVIGRDGTLAAIDLFSDPPQLIAQIRIGYEARAVGASRHPGYADRFVLAGAYWPPQLVLLDGQTLEPLRLISTRGRTVGTRIYHPEPRVTDIAGSFAHPEFLAHIKETGHVYLFPYDNYETLRIIDVDAARELRAGRFATDNRYYLTPADVDTVAVIDTDQQRLAARVPAELFGAGPGASFEHPEFGPVWINSSPLRSELVVIGTDPEGRPESAWQRVATVAGPGPGSMFIATHPRSNNLWVDVPLSGDPELSQGLAVYNKADLGAGHRILPVASWAELGEGPKRVLHPTYNPRGDEVWAVVWNPQNLNAAVVVIDDKTLRLKTVIADSRIITPLRVFNVAELKRGG